MADNIENTGGEKPADNTPTFTEIEQKALDQGWRPKDEWDGEPDQWRSAREFLDRGELFKKIDEQNRIIKQTRSDFEDLAKHYSKVQKVEYERALATLKAQKKEALQEGDADAVVNIDDQIADVKAQMKAEAEKPSQVPAQLNPIFVAWQERNGWYTANEAMRAYADRVGNSLIGQPPEEILAEVERRVKKEFAHKFENPRRERPSAVEGGTNKSSGKKEEFPLTDQQRRVAQKLIKTIPGFTMEKYIADLKNVKDL